MNKFFHVFLCSQIIGSHIENSWKKEVSEKDTLNTTLEMTANASNYLKKNEYGDFWSQSSNNFTYVTGIQNQLWRNRWNYRRKILEQAFKQKNPVSPEGHRVLSVQCSLTLETYLSAYNKKPNLVRSPIHFNVP